MFLKTMVNIEIRFRALAGNIVLCSWARHFILTVTLSSLYPGVYGTGKFAAGG